MYFNMTVMIHMGEDDCTQIAEAVGAIDNWNGTLSDIVDTYCRLSRSTVILHVAYHATNVIRTYAVSQPYFTDNRIFRSYYECS